MKRIKILGMLLALLVAQPAWAASDELIYGMSNEVALLGIVGGAVFILFACILTLAYMLYQSIPAIMQKRMDDAKDAHLKS